jgi:hypothetical protein
MIRLSQRGTRIAVAALASMLAISPLAAQQAEPAPPPARPADVASVDAILAALYDVISGDSGLARDWNRFRSLFAPDARLIPVGPRQAGAFGARVLTPEEYIRAAGPFLERGFHEREVARRSESYGQIVHAFSTYESFRRRTDAAPFARGINSIQLWSDGTRWWVMTILWWGETPQTPIPERYLRPEHH